jgi:hypothetical protein
MFVSSSSNMTDQKPPIPSYNEKSTGVSNTDSKKKLIINQQEFKHIEPNDNNASMNIKLNRIGSNSTADILSISSRKLYQRRLGQLGQRNLKI